MELDSRNSFGTLLVVGDISRSVVLGRFFESLCHPLFGFVLFL